MVRKVLVSVLVLLVMASAAWAQTPKVEFTGIIGWTLSDGVSGDPVKAARRTDLRPRRSERLGELRLLARVLREPVS